MSKIIKGVLIVMLLISLFTSCAEPSERRITDVRIYQNTPAWELARAVRSQDVRRIARIGESNPELLDFQDPVHGMTLLFWAVGMERYEAAEALLKAGADPDIISVREGGTALYRAAGFSFIDNNANRDPRFVKLLLAHGADPNIGFVGSAHNTSEIGITPLMRSIRGGIEKTRALVEAGADINFATETGLTAAIHALRAGTWNVTDRVRLYAHYLIVELQAIVTEPYIIRSSGGEERKAYPVDILRNWVARPGSEGHRIKMEIVEEFARQGVDYWATEIPQRVVERFQSLYPDTWEEYLKIY